MARRPVRFITPQECRAWLEKSFGTLRQRHKARLVLSGVFGTAVKRGWCRENPVAYVDLPRLQENPIPVLSLEEMHRLLTVAAEYANGACLARYWAYAVCRYSSGGGEAPGLGAD